MSVLIRPCKKDDWTTILRLNADSVAETSPMTAAHFDKLRPMSSRIAIAAIDGKVVAFVMAFSDSRPYESPNYRWFTERLKKFCYIDRIVVDASQRGNGIGQLLYADTRQWAIHNSYHWLAVDINHSPPNLESDRFHRKQGFIIVGQQSLNHAKTVTLRLCPLPSPSPLAANTDK